jgi:hypothetical protein
MDSPFSHIILIRRIRTWRYLMGGIGTPAENERESDRETGGCTCPSRMYLEFDQRRKSNPPAALCRPTGEASRSPCNRLLALPSPLKAWMESLQLPATCFGSSHLIVRPSSNFAVMAAAPLLPVHDQRTSEPRWLFGFLTPPRGLPVPY